MVRSTSNKVTKVKKQFLSKKFFTFIICLGIASLLWVMHALNLNYKHVLHVPVKFINLPTHKIIVGDLPEKLDVEIKTSGLKLLFIVFSKRNAELVIDFNSLISNAKTQAYTISNGNFSLKDNINFNVDIIKIRPDTLFFTSTNANARLIPVKLNLKTEMSSCYAITSKPIITPAYISVSGDSISIAKIDTVYTDLTIVKDISKNYNAFISLKNTNKNVHYNVKEVQVSFNVDRLTEASIELPVEFVNNNSSQTIKLLPSFVTVKYLVSMKDFDLINANSFKATVNYKQVQEKQKILQVELLRKPSEVKILRIEPSTISYLIYK
jgi:hypothetical protein